MKINPSKTYRCPACKERKPITHFACASGALGGASVRGAKKVRGDGRYYAYLRKQRKEGDSQDASGR